MKNLTRVLALVLVFSLVLGTVAFAAFTDVKDTDDYAEAIETLAALGIIKGYEDGTFGADKAITRAEAVAIVNRIQNLAGAAAGAQGASLYTDVAANHWALGDINLATQMGTVSGDGNGLFRPEDQVSYQEMVKMLVVALGYQPAANDKGGWPTGYLVTASQYGVLDDTVNGGATPANRGVVAQLTFNALTAPMMEQTGFGNDKSYEVKDVPGSRKTLLTEKLSIYKVDVTPVANDVTSIASGSKANVGEVRVEIDMNTKTVRSDSDAFYGVKTPISLSTSEDSKTTETFIAGNSDLGDKLAYSAVAYIQKNADKEWEVLYSTIEDGKTRTFDIDPTTVTKVENDKIYVEDEDIKLDEEYEFDSATTVIYNGEKSDKKIDADLFKYTKDGATIEGKVTVLINGKADDVADYIFVDVYYTDRVSDESATGNKIYLENNGTINLDTKENKKLVYTLTLDGKDISPADLKEGDIVTYRATEDKNFYEILVSRTTVEGEIDSTFTEDSVDKYEIAGKNYEESVSAKNNNADTKLGSVKPGYAGTFYLDVFGKIAYYEKSSVTGAAKNYAYVTNYGKISGGDNNPKYGVEMFLTDGKAPAYYELASKVRVTKNSKDGTEVKEEELGDDDKTSYFTTVVDKEITEGETTKTVKGLNSGLEAVLEAAKGKVVDYTLNTSGLISDITYWEGEADASFDESLFTFGGSIEDEFNERRNVIGNFSITEDTVVFYVGENDIEEYQISDKTFFVEDEAYDIDAYCVIKPATNKEAGVIVVKNAVSSASLKDNIAVFVSSALAMNKEEGTRVQTITFYQNGEPVTLYGDSQSIEGIKGLDTGDVFTFKKNTKGEVVSVTKVELDSAKYAYPANANSGDVNYVFGQLVSRSGLNLELGALNDEEATDVHVIPATANVYLVDYKASKVTVGLGDVKEIAANRYVKGFLEDPDQVDNYMVAIKYLGDDVIGVVLYRNVIESVVKLDDKGNIVVDENGNPVITDEEQLIDRFTSGK